MDRAALDAFRCLFSPVLFKKQLYNVHLTAAAPSKIAQQISQNAGLLFNQTTENKLGQQGPVEHDINLTPAPSTFHPYSFQGGSGSRGMRLLSFTSSRPTPIQVSKATGVAWRCLLASEGGMLKCSRSSESVDWHSQSRRYGHCLCSVYGEVDLVHPQVNMG